MYKINIEQVNDGRVILTIKGVCFDFLVDEFGLVIDRYLADGHCSLETIHAEDL